MGAWSSMVKLFKGPLPNGPLLISPMQNLSREYPEDGITIARYRQILRDADIGLTARYMEWLDLCSTDFKVASVLRTRKLAVAGAPWRVEPPEGDASALGKTVADETADFLRRMPNFTQFKMDLLDAHYRGFATMRLGWAVQEGRQLVVEQDAIESRFLRFHEGSEPYIMTMQDPNGVPLPSEYLFHVVRDKPGPVTRGGTGRSIGKLVFYKGFNLVDTASYIEKYGQPHIQVLLPANITEGSPELERAKSAARSIITDNIGLVPAGVTIEVLESIKQTSTVNDTYLAFMNWLDEGIAQAELGHTLTSGASQVGGLGHGGEADEAADVKQEIKQYDAAGLIHCLHIQKETSILKNQTLHSVYKWQIQFPR